jgi:hypothetical protein
MARWSKALARAWRGQRILDEGCFASARELAKAARVGLPCDIGALKIADTDAAVARPLSSSPHWTLR